MIIQLEIYKETVWGPPETTIAFENQENFFNLLLEVNSEFLIKILDQEADPRSILFTLLKKKDTFKIFFKILPNQDICIGWQKVNQDYVMYQVTFLSERNIRFEINYGFPKNFHFPYSLITKTKRKIFRQKMRAMEDFLKRN